MGKAILSLLLLRKYRMKLSLRLKQSSRGKDSRDLSNLISTAGSSLSMLTSLEMALTSSLQVWGRRNWSVQIPSWVGWQTQTLTDVLHDTLARMVFLTVVICHNKPEIYS